MKIKMPENTKLSIRQLFFNLFSNHAKTVYVDSAQYVAPEVTSAIASSSAAAVVAAKTPVVAILTTATPTVSTDTSLADIFTVSVTQSITINCTNGVDGKGTTWLLTQANGGSKTITLGTDFLLPDSASTPLGWSTTVGKTDLLAARYSTLLGKWMVVSMVPGY
jgi:hypothetical protein